MFYIPHQNKLPEQKLHQNKNYQKYGIPVRVLLMRKEGILRNIKQKKVQS